MGFRSILALPAAYRLSIRILSKNLAEVYLETYVRSKAGDKILDIGCGPGDILAHLPDGVDYTLPRKFVPGQPRRLAHTCWFLSRPDRAGTFWEAYYVGIDISARYIEAARARFGKRGNFVCKALRDVVLDEPGRFDLAMATGVVHHLDDAEARDLYRLARQALRSGGRLVTLDGCFVPGQSRVARYLLTKDRGRFVREQDAYVAMARESFSDVKASLRHDLLRVPYTHVILECTA